MKTREDILVAVAAVLTLIGFAFAVVGVLNWLTGLLG